MVRFIIPILLFLNLIIIIIVRGRYDFAHILKYAPSFQLEQVEVLAKNTQNFMSITINNRIILLDSLNHLPNSLARLSETVLKDGIHKFKITKQMIPPFSDEDLKKFVLRKQVIRSSAHYN